LAGYIIDTNAPHSFRRGHILFCKGTTIGKRSVAFQAVGDPFKGYDAILWFFR